MLNFHSLGAEELEIAHDLLNIKPKRITPKVRNYLNRHKVYISCTTSPLRLKKLPIVLNLLDLSEVSEIHINLPKQYRNKKDGGVYKQQDIDLVKSVDSRIKIHRIPEDIGPLTKIIPTLLRVHDPLSIVISIDDDIGYPYNLVSSIIHHSVTRPREICCGAGIVFGDYPGSEFNRNFWPRLPSRGCVDIVEGWGGIGYKKSIVTIRMIEEILKLNKLSVDCKLSDDFTISYVLAEHGIKAREIPGIRDRLESFTYGFDADALNQGSGVEKSENVDDMNMVKYHRCLEHIPKKTLSRRRSRTK